MAKICRVTIPNQRLERHCTKTSTPSPIPSWAIDFLETNEYFEGFSQENALDVSLHEHDDVFDDDVEVCLSYFVAKSADVEKPVDMRRNG